MRALLRSLRRWWLDHEHPRRSRVFTLRHQHPRHYVVCLDCGKEFEYDLAAMRLTGREIRRRLQAPDRVALEREWQDALAQPGFKLRRQTHGD